MSQKISQGKGVTWAVAGMMICTAASNYLVEIPINDWLTWGAFTYPFVFFITELTNFFYGPKTARRVVYIGFALAVTLAFLWMNRRIAFASSVAFLVGQLLDIQIFSQLRKKRWWIAPATASITASLIDTGIFFSIAFAGEALPWVSLAFGDFAIKLAMDILLLLPFRFVLWRERGT